ncbi:TPA: tail fiber domain-containing protein, partial [Escherichia coli]|nr:tail fiber domain-containing protein [Escherichia coli]
GGFVQTALTVTSDEQEKTRPAPFNDALLDAWQEVEYCQYQYIDRVITKGDDGARWHFGLVAQRAEEVFSKHGLDISQYGFFCKDYEIEKQELSDDEGNIIQEYQAAYIKRGLRYEEALILEAALQRRNYLSINHRLENLESQ